MSRCLDEDSVRTLVPEHYIVRISWVFGINVKSFVKTMSRLGAEREQLTVVNDQIGSPTYTEDLSALLADMIVTEQHGTYRATNEGFCSWFDFPCAIMREAGLLAKNLPVSNEHYPSRA